MKLKARSKDEDYTFQDLQVTFDPNEHKNAEDFEALECGCIWWKCSHCEHGNYRTICMICDDPFDRI